VERECCIDGRLPLPIVMQSFYNPLCTPMYFNQNTHKQCIYACELTGAM
jgi:hypothetical protein